MNTFCSKTKLEQLKKILCLTFFSIEIFFDLSIKFLNTICLDQS